MSYLTEELGRIRKLLAGYAAELRLNAKANRLSEHISAEDICGGLLNLVYNYSLENANQGRGNQPAVDLVDPERGVAAQITSRNDSAKVRDTLERFHAVRNGSRLSDTYSHLIILILTDEKKFKGYEQLQSSEPGLSIMNFVDLSAAIEHIGLKDLDRVRQIRRYLECHIGLCSVETMPDHLLPLAPAQSGCFVRGSRDGEIATLLSMMGDGDPVYIWGVGGIGKTEVAIQLARRFAPPKGAYFLRYTLPSDGEGEAMRETILQARFTDYHYSGTDPEADYRARMDIVRKEYAGALLIIDNFDWPGRSLGRLQSEVSFRELTQTGARLVFTTRCVAGQRGVQIAPISDEGLLSLMRDILGDMPASDRELLDLIHAVGGHTLMVELMARTLLRGHGTLTPANLLEKLGQNDLDQKDMPGVGSELVPDLPEMRIASHLRILFDMSKMSPWERIVLRNAALLPEDGMDYGLFQECVSFPAPPAGGLRKLAGGLFGKKEDPPAPAEALRRLADCGWLICRRELLMIHPVIRTACWDVLKPTDGNCGDFLFALAERFSPNDRYDAARFLQMARVFSLASDRLQDPEGYWALFAGRIWNSLGQAQTALRYDQRMVQRQENSPAGNDIQRAAAYNFLGVTYIAVGDYRKALEHVEKGLELRKKALPPDHMDIAISLDNVGSCYHYLGMRHEALGYLRQALEIMEKDPSRDSVDLALAYNNLGGLYVDLDEPEECLKWERRALELLAGQNNADPQILALICNNVGLSCRRLGEYEKAMQFMGKALSIREERLPPDHPHLAHSYSDLAALYGDLNEHETALRYARKALEIRQAIIRPDHPDLAVSYNNVGGFLVDMGQYPQALEYRLKAIEIMEKALPPDHPMLAVAYHNAGYCYAHMEKREEAMVYWQKALRIQERKLEPGHPELEKTRKSIAALREELAEDPPRG